MNGKNVLITGGARGMGRITAETLASMGAQVFIADWEGEHGARSCAEINAKHPNSTQFIYCNLAEMDSVQNLIDTLKNQINTLDVLICNAGITYPQRQTNSRGIEMHVASCHLGHFQLCLGLIDLLKAAPAGRLVFVSSEGHKACKGLDFDDLNNEKIWQGRAINHSAGFMAYSRAKLANLYTMLEWHERLKDSKVSVNAASPGFFVNTGIHREMRGLFKWGAQLVFGLVGLLGLSTAAKGARTHIWLASAPEAGASSGEYFENCQAKTMCSSTQDNEARQRLWALSEDMLKP